MKGSELREAIGLVAVVASLAFVGLEIRQNNNIALAQTRQSVLDTYVVWQMTMFENPELASAFETKYGTPPADSVFPAGTPFAMWVQMRMLENVYLQVEQGVGDESFFDSYGWADRGMFRTDEFREWWQAYRHRFHPGFVSRFEADYDLAP